MKEFGLEKIIFVCTDSTEIFFSTCQVFSLTLTVRGVSNKHCLLTFFILSIYEWSFYTGFIVQGNLDRNGTQPIYQ